jgi:Concanavalin A-like lectin/glucanases superfamily
MLSRIMLAAFLSLGPLFGAAWAAPEEAADDVLLLLKFDEGQGATISDAGPGKHKVKLTGGTWAEGKEGKSLVFDGKTRVEVGNPPALDFGTDVNFTVDCWVKIEAETKPGFYYLASNRIQMDKQPGYSLYLHRNGSVVASIGDGAKAVTIIGKTSIKDGGWHHVALACDRAGSMFLYVDGALEGEKGIAGLGSLTHKRHPLFVGSRGHSGDFIGTMDSFQIRKGVHKPGAVAAAAGGPATVLLLHFDEGKGLAAKNALGRAPHGRIKKAQWVEGKFGKALKFDGKNSFVDLGNPAVLDFGKKHDFTVECWIKVPADLPKGWFHIMTNRLRVDMPGFTINIHPNKCVMASVADKINATEGIISKTKVNDDQWHHVALVCDRDGNATLYIDGKKEAEKDMSFIVSVSNPDRPFRIGDRGYDGDFIGLIDEVRVTRGLRKEFSLDAPYKE